jgi:hypothetical protein
MYVPEKNPVPAMPALSLYETDFYAWTQAQAALLRNHQWKQLDLQNLIEEIECLGETAASGTAKPFECADWTFAEMGVPTATPQP